MYRQYRLSLAQGQGTGGATGSSPNTDTPTGTSEPEPSNRAVDISHIKIKEKDVIKKQGLSDEYKKEELASLEAQKAQAAALEAQILSMMATLKRSQDNVSALRGDVTVDWPSDAKVVRIFTSSTFTDTKQERNFLMKNAYPKIKDHCRGIGYEFQVVDMRWGLRDEALDDHVVTELCLKELKLCQELSTGPSFVTLLSHKYGYTVFPRVILASEFEAYMNEIEDEYTLELLNKWYTRDDNAIPPEYVLSPISKFLPDFVSKDSKDKKVAKEKWWAESDCMQAALEQTATKLYDKQYARKFIMSVSETEIKQGLLDVKEASNYCLWLKRNIVDIDKQEKGYALSRFMECLGPEKKDTKAQTMLKELKENGIMKKLKDNRVLEYNVHWAKDGARVLKTRLTKLLIKGINPETSEEHREYLKKMSEDFVQTMLGMIDTAVAAKSGNEDPLVNECLQHIRFCQEKCRNFQGREETLEQIKAYVTATDAKKSPLIIHGESGSGKTSIMAMVAKLTAEWVKPKPLILLRFLGTTEQSSSLMALLYSLTSQLERCLKLKVSPRTELLEVQKARFWLMVYKYQRANPLVIILDSLDQLDAAYDARKLQWIIPQLAKGTIVMSTLEEPQYECFPALQGFITEPSNFISVPTLSRESSSQILSSWFKANKRQVTDKQMDMLLSAFDKCPTPLFLKLSFDEAIRWTSYISDDETVLCDTVRASINHLFKRLEILHGKVLLSRALAYLTVARNGTSEVELEDILSCDDDVLNDVYMYWTPPTRRLPPLLMVRIRTDLSQYLVERGADGVRVLYWYHRQFIEAAEERYCSDPETIQLVHRNLADFFSGKWANGIKKPYTNSSGVTIEEDRYVSAQPLQFGEGKYNIRMLNNLPYHTLKGRNVGTLIERCLGNIEFLRTKMIAVNFMSVIDDFKMANKAFPNKPLISGILGVLQLSQKGLKTDPRQIVSQMVQRLAVTNETSEFLQQCRAHQQTFLEPSMPLLDLPGGQLVHNIATHSGDVDMIDVTTDGKIALTVCVERKEKFLWCVEEAKKLRAIQSAGDSEEAYFCMNNEWVVRESSKGYSARFEDVQTGSEKLQVKLFKNGFCVAGAKKDILVAFQARCCNMYNLAAEGEMVGDASLAQDEKKFGEFSVRTGSANFVALTDADQYFVSVLDIRNQQFLKQFRAFPKTKEEDGYYDEHEVEAMRISPDEKCLVYTTMFTSEVVFTDFEGTKLRSIPGNKDRSYGCLELSPDGGEIFLSSDNNVYIINWHTLEEIDVIEHAKNVKKVKVPRSDCVVTMCADSNLRIWDLSREKLNTGPQFTFLKEGHIKSAQLMENPRYLLTNNKLKDDIMIAVYDIFKEEAVKTFKIKVPGIVNGRVVLVPVPGTPEKVYLVVERKLYIIDLNTVTITMCADGYMCRRYWNLHSGVHFSAKNEIVCLTKGARNLKLYDTTTGRVTKVIKSEGHKSMVQTFVVGKSGMIAAALTEDDLILVFDLIAGKQLYTVFDKEKYKDAGYELLVTGNDTVLLFTAAVPLKELGDKLAVTQVIIWDIENNKEIGRMLDLDYEKKYRQSGKAGMEGNTSVTDIYELDDQRTLTVSFDDIIRIHYVSTGALLHRLEGHFSSPKIYIEPKSPFLLTLASMDEEGCLRLWDKQTFECLASFTLEKDINHISISPDGRFFTSILDQSSKNYLVRWRIHHGPFDCIVKEIDYPEVFFSDAEGQDLVFDQTATPVQQDPQDVDTDVDYESADDYEDDDDDDEEDDNKDDDNDDDDDL